MSGIAMRYTENALILEYTVAVGGTATAGEAVTLSSDTTVTDANGATDLAVGVALAAAVASAQVQVAMFGHAVIPALVGTGGATRGTKAILVANGFTNAPAHDSDNTGNSAIYGVFLQTGVAGDIVGLMLCGISNRGNA